MIDAFKLIFRKVFSLIGTLSKVIYNYDLFSRLPKVTNLKYNFFLQGRFFKGAPLEDGTNMEVIYYCKDELFQDSVDALNALSFPDIEHDVDHAHRVATMCMALYSQIEPNGENAVKYYLMGFLHDLGRTGGGTETDHGERSADLIQTYGFNLSEPYLEAIRWHTSRQQPATLQEQCLFDADRLDLCRFGKEISAYWISPSLRPSLNEFTVLATLFIRNKYCCFITPNIKNRQAVAFFIYLHRHLNYLIPERLYHGSPKRHLTKLSSIPVNYPIKGNCLFATADLGEAAYIMLKWRDQFQQEFSIYEVDTVGVEVMEFNFLGIEYVFRHDKRALNEFTLKRVPGMEPFKQYEQLLLNPDYHIKAPAAVQHRNASPAFETLPF